MAGYKEKKSFIYNVIPHKSDSKPEMIRKVVFLSALVIFIASACIVAHYFIEAKRNRDLQAEIERMHETTYSVITQATTTAPPETETEPVTTPPPPLVLLDSMASIVEENSDTAGWLTIPNTNINYVVLQGADNDYYLDHNFYGKYAQAGSIYADFRCKVNYYNNEQSDNIVIYGHNQADGSMFGTLKKYKITHQNTRNFQFYLDNPTFTFSNLYEEYTYKIIAMFIIEALPEQTRDGNLFDYHNYVRFKEPTRSFDTYKENVLAHTAVDTGVDFEYGDKFITLSTCSNEFDESRFVVIGRRVREGEDPYVDTSLAVLNEDAIEPDLNYIYSR